MWPDLTKQVTMGVTSMERDSSPLTQWVRSVSFRSHWDTRRKWRLRNIERKHQVRPEKRRLSLEFGFAFISGQAGIRTSRDSLAAGFSMPAIRHIHRAPSHPLSSSSWHSLGQYHLLPTTADRMLWHLTQDPGDHQILSPAVWHPGTSGCSQQGKKADRDTSC